MKYEIIENGEIVNAIEADEVFMAQAYPDGNYREVAPVDFLEVELAEASLEHLEAGMELSSSNTSSIKKRKK